ncbi:M43 family zinc metalloprotease [Jejuia spongiicola]|uniref:M43 family zinc metalloprotease n=1 Tax=Jejuia spongiicola TaxID=2942207 RepID=A0ABT0QG15_9FLAO|nr:M43 family zinc metalloprotease [Jejuia spongiicola]MCL6294865.1 M43 family zinc metalloprotease [Jejuia spongiicola]
MSSCNSYLVYCGERNNKSFIASDSQLKQETQYKYYNTIENKEIAKKIRIPVVFHVLYRNSSMKISKESIQSEITVLNENFSASNKEIDNIVPDEIKHKIGTANIEFYLAQTDPQGNVTDGIIYRKTKRKFYSFARPIFYADPLWNPKKYMNVYVGNVRVNKFKNTSGYVDHPRIWRSPEKDAIAVSYNRMGKGNKLLTHETGHWLGLRHIFERKKKCDLVGDGIDDTPNQKTATSNCPDSKIQCGNPIYFFNFMDYSSCRVMFTIDQVDRMHNVIYKYRNELIRLK